MPQRDGHSCVVSLFLVMEAKNAVDGLRLSNVSLKSVFILEGKGVFAFFLHVSHPIKKMKKS